MKLICNHVVIKYPSTVHTLNTSLHCNNCSEIMLKIGELLAKIRTKVRWRIIMAHGVHFAVEIFSVINTLHDNYENHLMSGVLSMWDLIANILMFPCSYAALHVYSSRFSFSYIFSGVISV